jgi:anhydro-N-acetylmuramic acid kinase
VSAPLCVLGLMSGTSVDGIDAALCALGPDAGDAPGALRGRLLYTATIPWPVALRARVLALCRAGAAPLDEVTELHYQIGDAFADAALAAIGDSGRAPGAVDLIVSHGQTIYHLMQAGRRPSTLQIGQPAVIAARTGVTTMGDLRAADVAAGGQGAPLVAFFDALVFRDPVRRRALLNLGGMANVSLVLPDGPVLAFDTGPANSLIDYAARHYSGGAETCDRDGRLARGGRTDSGWLAALLADPYYASPPPKSTGREYFGDMYAERALADAASRGLAPPDAQATLTALTAQTVSDAIRRYGPPGGIDELIVSGGGARNPALMDALRAALPDGVQFREPDAFGVPAQAKEAMAFALLGYEGLHGRPAALAAGGAGAVLGCLAPGANYRPLIGRVAAGLEEAPWPVSRSLRWIN